MIDAADLIDDEVLVYQLLTRDVAAQDEITGITVAASIDVDERQPLALPHVSFTCSGTGQAGNGPGLWDTALTVSTLAIGMDAAKALARLTYRIVHGWSDPDTSRVAGIGGVLDVTDIAKPSRQPAATIAAGVLVQYDAIYGLQLLT